MHELNGRNSDESTYLAATWPLEPGREPPLAAHLVTPRRGYTHHGLYVGGGRVIHYSGFAGGVRRGTVEEVSLPCFAHGHAVQVMPRDSQRFENGEVVRRARSRLGENCYRLLSNNGRGIRRQDIQHDVTRLFRSNFEKWTRLNATGSSLSDLRKEGHESDKDR